MGAANDYKLELFQVVFRHGARTYSKTEANCTMPDHVDRSLTEKYGYEQLTNIGKRQAYKLGCALRERYNDFLGDHYRPDELYAYTSDTDRTKMSLQLVLAGLYPPSEEETWNPNLKWMPIPFHFVEKQSDALLKGFDKTKYQLHLHAAQKEPKFQYIFQRVLELSKVFEEKGLYVLKDKLHHGCMGVFNILSTHKAANAKLPDWCTDDLYEKIKEVVIIYFDIMSLTTEMKKLLVGPLVKKLLENMNIENEVSNQRKVYLYSAHELNVAALLRAHKIEDLKYPDFGSAVILEKFRNSKNQLYVRMLAWTGKDDKFITLKLGKFDEFCPIQEYTKIITDIVPSDEDVKSIINDKNFDIISYLKSNQNP